MATVSAILPIYNVKKYLVRCLESVLHQSIPFDKIILVNDGSTDGCQDICSEYAEKYNEIKLINKPNGGLVSAWKEGLKYVDTTHICFIDSDDYIAPDYLETLLNGLSDGIDMVCMNAIQAFDNGQLRLFRINGLDAGIYDINSSIKGIMLSNKGSYVRPVSSSRWAKLIRTDLVKDYSKYCKECISYGEDQQLTLGVLLGCKRINLLDEYKYYYQYNNNSILHTYRKDLWVNIEILMKTISEIPGIDRIPHYQKQFNTQVLLYYCECLRNESNNGMLNKKKYNRMLGSSYVHEAFGDFYDENLRKIDRLVLKYAQSSYLKTSIILKLFKIYAVLKRLPG